MMRILVATDQPFWLRSGGAQERIYQLLSGLKQLHNQTSQQASHKSNDGDASFQVATFFLGAPDDLPGPDSATAAFCDRDLIEVIDCPRSLEGRGGWLNAAVARFRNLLGGKPESSDCNIESSGKTALTLESYRWPWVLPHFRKMVQRFQPDIILLEYVTMSYLRAAIDDRSIVWALDTHDRLSLRCQLFQDAGQRHWLDISEQQEVESFHAADLLVAINDDDAHWMNQMAPEVAVVVAKHGIGHHSAATDENESNDAARNTSRPLRVGMIASDNFPNRQAVDWLLDHVWNQSNWCMEETPRLILAGRIGAHVSQRWPNQNDKPDWLEVLGPVENLDDFYSQVDLTVSPMTLGTGLKIKTSEAIAFGKPVICSPHSAEAFSDVNCGIIVAETPAQWQQAIRQAGNDPDYLKDMTAAAIRYSQASLGHEAVYDRLYQVLRQMVEAKKTV